MRNELAIQVLNKDMLYLMKAYQATLHNPQNLASSIELLENTSTLVDIFCTINQPISSLQDPKFETLNNITKFFTSLENAMDKSVMHISSKKSHNF